VRCGGRYAAALRQRAALAEVAAGLAAADLGESCRMRQDVIPVAVVRRCAMPSCLHWQLGTGVTQHGWPWERPPPRAMPAPWPSTRALAAARACILRRMANLASGHNSVATDTGSVARDTGSHEGLTPRWCAAR